MKQIQSLRKLPAVMTIGEKIRNLRERKGITQSALASELNKFQKQIDVSRDMISHWELDMHNPQVESLIMLSNFFGVTVDALVRPELKLQISGKRTSIKAKVTR